MFEARDSEFVTKVEDSWQNQNFLRLLGAALNKIEPGYCEIELTIRDDHYQSHGFVSGAIIGALADVAGGYAAYSLTPKGYSMLTAEYKINFLAPGAGEKLLAKGYVEKTGRTLYIARSEVYSVADSQETRCAVALMTMSAFEEK